MTQEPLPPWSPAGHGRSWSVPAVDPLSGAPVPAAPAAAASWAAPPGPFGWPPPQGGYPAPAPYVYPPAALYYPAYYPGPYVQAAATNGLAVAALVLGIVWLFWLGSILAVVFGHVARYQIRRSGERGDGLAVAGLVLGWIGIGVLSLPLFLGILGRR